jgi:hypothetical protein
MYRRLLTIAWLPLALLLTLSWGRGEAEPGEKAAAFLRYCGDGACARHGIGQREFFQGFKHSSRGADTLEYYDRDVDRFREKFLGYDKFTLEIWLLVRQPTADALHIRGQFTSWFDNDFTSLLKKEYERTCRIVTLTPLVCKISDDKVVIWFDRNLALHLLELVYDDRSKTYVPRQHRVIMRKAG